MKTVFTPLRGIALTLVLACLTMLGLTSMTPPATAHKADSTRIACNPSLAYQAVMNTKKANQCIDDALAAYPGWILNYSVQEPPGCGPTSLRGCTYVVSIWISCPFPGCLAPDYLVLDADVSCTFEVTSINCY